MGLPSRPRAKTSTASMSAAVWASSRRTRSASSVTPLAADAESADPFMHASMLACAGDGQGPLSLNRTPVALVPGCPWGRHDLDYRQLAVPDVPMR